jgi:hypothetical protein
LGLFFNSPALPCATVRPAARPVCFGGMFELPHNKEESQERITTEYVIEAAGGTEGCSEG